MEGEVGKSRLAEFKAIEKEVDERAKKMTRAELGMTDKEWLFGSCHTFWKYKKKILLEEYHMRWRSPKDLNPGVLYD